MGFLQENSTQQGPFVCALFISDDMHFESMDDIRQNALKQSYK
jgi:hypothetical protein